MLCSNILKKQGLTENLENMSSFEIIKEFGFTAILREKEGMLPPTPWLLSVNEGLKLNQVRFEEFTLELNDTSWNPCVPVVKPVPDPRLFVEVNVTP